MTSEPSQDRLLYHHTSIPRKPVQFEMANFSRKQSSFAGTYEINPYDDAPSNSSTTLDNDDMLNQSRQKHTITPAQMDSYAADSAPFAANKFSRWSRFTGLIVTTVVSTLLYVAGKKHWVMPLNLQVYVETNSSNVRSAVQVASLFFGYMQTMPMGSMINQASRLHLVKKNTSLNRLWLWFNICYGTFTFKLPLKMWFILCAYLVICLGPSATWAPAISPTTATYDQKSSVAIVCYTNMSLIHEYSPLLNSKNPPLSNQTRKGVFTYGVGTAFQGAILSSASSATPVNTTFAIQRTKLDNTGFLYLGRSYGVGATVGLTDDDLVNSNYNLAYNFTENGYNARVTCTYNASTAFGLETVGGGSDLYQTTGFLPDSNGQLQNATYFSKSGNSTVAVGVSSTPFLGTKRYLGIAAGSDYSILNTTQCTVDFVPTAFQVFVNITAKNITVTPSSLAPVNIDSSGNLITTAIRQIAIISESQTNFYQSLVGNSFLSSISAYELSQNLTTHTTNATLTGLQNSITSMLDDILAAYASAQAIIGPTQPTQQTVATITKRALAFGTPYDNKRAFIWNCVILVIFLIEALRTRGWSGMHGWDYMDLRSVIVSTSRGGRRIADKVTMYDSEVMPTRGGCGGCCCGGRKGYRKIGTTMVGLEQESGALVLAEDRVVRKRNFSLHPLKGRKGSAGGDADGDEEGEMRGAGSGMQQPSGNYI